MKRISHRDDVKKHLGVKFSLRGEPWEMYLLELVWIVGLYSQLRARENATLSRLSRAETVKATYLLMELWPSIGDGKFNVGNTKVASIRNPRVKLAHRCIATTISGRKESTHRVIEIDLYYLYCIYMERVVYNIPYWLAKYLKSIRDKILICRVDVCDYDCPIFWVADQINKGCIRICVWPATRAVEKDDEAEEEVGGEAANMGAGGSAKMYRNMSQGDWQVRQALWMEQQDKGWGQFDTWKGQHEAQANWMYDHTVREF
uniref:Zinc finger, CCHC-type n=1 Tax=Tanacetum cinerariifolium TaxID=118510 RepID=A0A699I489_TANCI|nr:zinc finger, CCHC-type [Tanacetum cinerariifolium]